jgi:hypothetical protein
MEHTIPLQTMAALQPFEVAAVMPGQVQTVSDYLLSGGDITEDTIFLYPLVIKGERMEYKEKPMYIPFPTRNADNTGPNLALITRILEEPGFKEKMGVVVWIGVVDKFAPPDDQQRKR